MATVRPFRGLRFTYEAGRTEDLVAPPYDVLSRDERNEFATKAPQNIVHLTLPEDKSDDRSKFVKYARSAALLEEWRRTGSMQLEPKPSFYRYSQTFSVPGTGSTFTRTSLIVLLKVEPYERGVVLPHEQTFPKHKEDRLRILEATRSHLECIFGLYEDDDNSIHALVSGAPASLLAEFVTPEDGIQQRLERIDDPDLVQSIVDAMAAKRLWIADGHHRYETALAFRAQTSEALSPQLSTGADSGAGFQPAPEAAKRTAFPGAGLIAEDFMMMAVDSMTDPGLVLLPTHRVLKTMPVSADELRAKMGEHFSIEPAPNTELMARVTAVSSMAFGVALPGGTGFVARANDPAKVAEMVAGPGSHRLKSLDVSVLHGFIFEKLLGLTGLDFFGYTRIEQEALEAVENGSPAAFLMNPPTVEDMRLIALGGEKMPQKSTYYYPKLLSGLVVWSLKDF